MNSYPLSSIASILGSVHPCVDDRTIDILLTDSRSLTFPERTLFFALVTDKGNGHRYIKDLYAKGVRAFVVSETIDEAAFPEAYFIYVKSTLRALQSLATAHRKALHIPVIGITGSNGKTTLKEILYQLLHRHLHVARSPKSYNSSIGVPLSIWGISPTADIALIEAGISKPDEMEVLEKIVRPTIGVITNIGDAHQENFQSLDQKCMEKLRLFARADMIVYCADDEIITRGLERLSLLHKSIGWSAQDSTAPIFVRRIERASDHTMLHINVLGKRTSYRLPYTDEGSIHDVLTAITLLLKVRPSLLWDEESFTHLEPISMRLEVIEGDGGMMLINDTYNSDYDSLRIALDQMVRRNSDGREMVLILSEIRESGTHPSELYKRIAGLMARYSVSRIYAIGDALIRHASYFKIPIKTYRSTDEFLANLPRPELYGKVVLLKGARSACFERIVHALEKHTHQTILDVNLSNIVHNIDYFRSLLPIGTRITCMVKAFGYGTGSYEIAHTLKEHHCDYLAVAVVDEGKALREQGVDIPIIVMNPERSTFIHLIEYRLQPEIYSITLLREFIRVADSLGEVAYPVHLKWDTGMHRMGLSPEQIDEVVELFRGTSSVRIASVFTHLATADDPEQDDFTIQQLDKIRSISARLATEAPYPFYTHALNTAGIIRFPRYAMDKVRLGIGLYGISPMATKGENGLRPVAGLRTVILQVQEVHAGDTIGYGRRGKVDRPSRIGIIPIGYADGIDRRLGNGNITFRTADGVLVPTIGNICMDTLMLDLTDAPGAVEGSEITIFDEELPIERISDAIGTIPYEILARLSPRVARRYYHE